MFSYKTILVKNSTEKSVDWKEKSEAETERDRERQRETWSEGEGARGGHKEISKPVSSQCKNSN